MDFLSLVLCLFSATAMAEVITTTVVIHPASASSATTQSSASTASSLPNVFNQAATSSSTLATSVSAAAAATSSSSAYSAEDGSNSSSGSYNGGSPGPGSAIDTDGGASGSEGSSGSIGNGGLIAIIVVVVLVAIFGIATTTLFVIAKRRQWNVRASIARASRRMTQGLWTPGGPRSAGNRRATVNTGRLGVGGDRRDVDTPRFKRFNAGVRELDAEKGNVFAGTASRNTAGREGGWAAKLWGNGWK